MVFLKVSYRVRAHQIAPFEEIFRQEILPLVREHGLRLEGFWKSQIGNVGEFLELWRFDDLPQLDRGWTTLINDPRIQAIFQRTGPMVEDENFSIWTPVSLDPLARAAGAGR